jgi:hypothetical protein
VNTPVGAERPTRTSVRALATFFVILSAVVLTVTGVVMYFKPAGLMTPTSHGRWVDLHIVMSLAMVLAACVHLWCNWKTLVHYLSRGTATARRKVRELALATAVIVVLTVASMAGLCPLGTLMPHRGPTGSGGPSGKGQRANASIAQGVAGAQADSRMPDATPTRADGDAQWH